MKAGCQQMGVKTDTVALGVSQCAFQLCSERFKPNRNINSVHRKAHFQKLDLLQIE